MSHLATEENFEIPPANAPGGALYGVLNIDANEWQDEWFFNLDEAQDAADAIAQSGLPLAVLTVDGGECLEQSGF